MQHVELFTIGHSNHSSAEFVELLQQHEISVVVDIRRFPGSRSFPQFNQEKLSATLRAGGIDYRWLEELGGRQPRRKGFDSPNTGLRNQSFRNYADYMLTDPFRSGVEQLEQISTAGRAVIMCAESVFWRCHRRLVSDFVMAHGGTVYHIFPNGDVKPHSLTAEARFKDGELTYPGPATLFD